MQFFYKIEIREGPKHLQNNLKYIHKFLEIRNKPLDWGWSGIRTKIQALD